MAPPKSSVALLTMVSTIISVSIQVSTHVSTQVSYFLWMCDHMDELHYPQGHYLDQIHAYATAQLANEDAGSMRFGTFRKLDHVCKFIAVNEDVQTSKLYPALRWIGYNNRYHDMKNSNPDGLDVLADNVKKCMLTIDSNLIDCASSYIFQSTSTEVFRVEKKVVAVTTKDAKRYGIRVSDLNMYNVLEGVNVLLNNEPDYIVLRDKQIFDVVINVYNEMQDMIRYKNIGLEAILKSCGL